jgi:cystathionine beta-synthase
MASVLDLIGNTPLIEVTRIECGPCRLFLKLESANPSGSLKDRPARTMIEAAEAEGELKPGGTIVEATAGNTGLGLALVGGRKGYRTLLVVPDKMATRAIPITIRTLPRRSRAARPGRFSSTSSPIRPIPWRMR